MIIVPSDEDDKHKKPSAALAPTHDDPPPTYTALVPHVVAPIPSGTSPGSLRQAAMKPSNYVSISRSNGSVRGTWLLDSSLLIPTAFLPPLLPDETEETRRNLYLKSSNGSIDAEITLAQRTLEDDPVLAGRQSTIYARAVNGPIKVILHTPHASRLPFHLSIEASNGPVTLYLPRPFNGFLSIRQSHGNTKFSHEVLTHLTTFSDVDRMHRCFVGDFSAVQEGQEWQGDEVVIDARNGSVKVHYEEEVQGRVEKQSGTSGKDFRF
ncbi:hypothetical protein C0992_000459 [Termitomyces sp. T32_za158]|nr:hypothetical protein C0992_000459 [Termitomyces sp. T32_za158]